MDWLTAQGNYHRFKGGHGQRGETKKSLAVEISNLLEEAGVLVKREPSTIITKIQEIVKSFRDEHQYKHQTGHGTADKSLLEKEVYGICKHYDALLPILGDRPSTKPLLTNKSMHSNSLHDDAASVSSSSPAQRSIKATSPETKAASDAANAVLTASSKPPSSKKSSSSKKTPSNHSKKSLVPSVATAAKNAKQKEQDIILTYIKNQSKALELKQQKQKQQHESRGMKRKFEIMKMRLELQHLGAIQEMIDEQFPLPVQIVNTSSILTVDSSTSDDDSTIE